MQAGVQARPRPARIGIQSGDGRFGRPMLRRLRAARFARVALFVAGFLAVAGAFGLHPEPAFEAAASNAALPGFSSASIASAGADACPACLAHRPIPAARLATAINVPLLLSLEAPLPAAFSVPATPSLAHDGRAPPSLA